MKKYKVALNRTYCISIAADDQERALRIAEFYVGNCRDESNKSEQIKYNFAIGDIELVINEATEVVKDAN